MKKNKTMRFASGLLVAVLLTTCAISGTFAKYITSANGSDSARVAKWGVGIAVTADVFSDAYKDETVTYQDDEQVSTITVQASSEGTKVVAPGTRGNLAAVTLSGTPEVDVAITYDATVTLDGWMVSGTPYCPIKFTVGSTDYTYESTGSATVAEFAETVSNAINAYSTTYHTNTDLSTVSAAPAISWEWVYSSSSENDVKDTALGNATTAPTIAINMTVTATQVD